MFLSSNCNPSLKPKFDVQGHRGCRGLMPENTLAAFTKAMQLGVSTLEMDVVISKDSQVVISHEPWFNFEITTTQEGKYLTEAEGHALNIYKMNYADVTTYDVGQKVHPRFPAQQKLAAHKPLLSEVFILAENFCKKNNQSINYNIEIKSTPNDEIKGYQPSVPVFCEQVMNEVKRHKLQNKCCIQSFDIRVLKYVHEHFPSQTMAYLVENNADYVSALKLLTFSPQIYSCDYSLLSKELIDDLHKQSIKIIPWTVNTERDIKQMLELGVDGIISDYPNKVIELASSNK